MIVYIAKYPSVNIETTTSDIAKIIFKLRARGGLTLVKKIPPINLPTIAPPQ